MPDEDKLIFNFKSSNSYYTVAQALARAGAFVCGGGVRDLYLDRKPNDLDVFIPKEQNNMWYRVLRESGFHQVRRKFYRNGLEIDVVSTDKTSPINIIEDFDCDVCKWYMNEQPIPLNAEVLAATKNLVATFNSNMDLFGTSPRRADKLRATGWTVLT